MSKHIVTLAKQSMSNGFIKTMKGEFANTEGKINMARLGAEAIGVLTLVIIWTLIPQIGNAVTSGMPTIDPSSGWADVANGTSLWQNAEPLLRVCVVVLIASLILAVIFELRAGKRDD